MMTLLLLPLLVVAAGASTAFDRQLHREEWTAFKLQHGKRYASAAEERARMAVFAQNRLLVARHNMRYALGLESFRLALNEFSDMSHDEFSRTMNVFVAPARADSDSEPPRRPPGPAPARRPPGPAPARLPRTVDWRRKGAVTRVKNQGYCGSCWAFAATGAVEAQVFLKTGRLRELSEQNLVDCSQVYGTNGCGGGYTGYALEYIWHVGIDAEAAYPYEGVNSRCRFQPGNATRPLIGYKELLNHDELELQRYVAEGGPVAVILDGGRASFQSYGGGVYYDRQCSSTAFNHAMLVVGYGTDETGGDYWLVKNSWGPSWGEHGYIRMARNRNNSCGIASYGNFPVPGEEEELEWAADE